MTMTKTEYEKFTKGVVNAARGLIGRTPDDKLEWRPDASFLKLGQVLRHVAESLGGELRNVMDGGWGIVYEGGEGGLPSADKFPTVKSVKEALAMIDADWKLFEERFAKVDERTLNTQVVKIPWMAPGTTLLAYLLSSTEHLSNHRMQLFMYLRLLGVKVNTAHLYGME
jgi:hypothetical protein